MTNKTLGNRYQIIKEIGKGGMARVFLAHCKLLKRNVAVKVLRPEFANDQDFLKRFNTEAQAAAALSHPNIVGIYDVGEENGIQYIIMEYVEGQTLKEYITANNKLSWKQTVEFAIQICKALEHAHKNNIVHRDIKPHNIILTKDGVLKVTDFGIARAATSSTVTLGGNTIGSVHYFSPEQARGGYTDAKSDIYSLGVVMYEMVTGKVPFDSENPVSIAIKHINENPVSPKEYNISLPLSVEKIILKAISKETSMRYQSATEMLQDLNKALQLPSFAADAPTLDDNTANTIKIPAVNVGKRPVTPSDDNKPKKESNDKKTIIWAIVTSVLIVSLFIVGVIAVINPNLFKRSENVEMPVPNLVGQVYDDMAKQYKTKNITITMVQQVTDKEYDEGVIISQDPKPGKMIKTPIEIQVIVSSGQKSVVIPDFANKNLSDVKLAMSKLGLQIIEVNEPSDTVPNGIVIRTVPIAGYSIKADEVVTVYISSGKTEVKLEMPNLVGEDIQVARRLIASSNLREGKITNVSSDKPKNVVLTQSIANGTSIAEYTEIDLTVSTGESVVATPTPTPANIKTKNVTITVPQDREKTSIKVVQDGKTVHNAIHNKDEKAFNVTISGVGEVKLEVYHDNVLASTHMVNL